jgi:hypothetical protein
MSVSKSEDEGSIPSRPAKIIIFRRYFTQYESAYRKKIPAYRKMPESTGMAAASAKSAGKQSLNIDHD